VEDPDPENEQNEEAFHTSEWPLSNLAIAVDRLATTEQSVAASWTRSTFCIAFIIGWHESTMDSWFENEPQDGGGRASEGRFQSSRSACCSLDRDRLSISLKSIRTR